MPFCTNCGGAIQPTEKFCSSCGASNVPLAVSGVQVATMPAPSSVTTDTSPVSVSPAQPSFQSATNTPSVAKETRFFKGEGDYIVKRENHKDLKVDSALLVVTNKALYCSGTRYLFDRFLSMGREGKSVTIDYQNQVLGARGTPEYEVIEIELKMEDKDQMALLFRALEEARMENVDL
ncbi:MAG: hypothetical protein ACYCQJ_09270 [Nitrososphaerales archaeon]